MTRSLLEQPHYSVSKCELTVNIAHSNASNDATDDEFIFYIPIESNGRIKVIK